MFGAMTMMRSEVCGRTVYMEVVADNKVAYRVITGRIRAFGTEVGTYGVEAEDYETGETECIADFSRNIEDAVDFAETLISHRSRPRQLYSRALNYLSGAI
ncbi:MAG: hypothetical protein IJM44_07885 [Ruminococcus sp.]|jgi:hypothetical protein|nr:hypothetical protein [Ruminococcus sp.]